MLQLKKQVIKSFFLEKIVRGGSDKSYGVYVAEMAGLPKTVILRARKILDRLSIDKNSDNLPKPELTINQIDLFNNNGIEIKNELNKLNIDSMTPLDALKKLSELKEKYDT